MKEVVADDAVKPFRFRPRHFDDARTLQHRTSTRDDVTQVVNTCNSGSATTDELPAPRSSATVAAKLFPHLCERRQERANRYPPSRSTCARDTSTNRTRSNPSLRRPSLALPCKKLSVHVHTVHVRIANEMSGDERAGRNSHVSPHHGRLDHEPIPIAHFDQCALDLVFSCALRRPGHLQTGGRGSADADVGGRKWVRVVLERTRPELLLVVLVVLVVDDQVVARVRF